MSELMWATIVAVDDARDRVTVQLEHDRRLLSNVAVNAATAVEGLVAGHPCLVAVLDDDGTGDRALLVTTRVESR